jgi:hypothetical protein
MKDCNNQRSISSKIKIKARSKKEKERTIKSDKN